MSSDYETQLTANAETIIAISRYTNMTALTARARQKGFEMPVAPVFVPVPGTPGGPLASGLQLDDRAPAAAPVGANTAHAATR